MTKVFEGTITQSSGETYSTSYTATVQVFANIEGKQVVFSDIGFGTGTNKRNPGEAHELATKGAVSDGLKRAAKNLGRSMGLALYDKSQEYVGSVASPETSAPVPSNKTPDANTRSAGLDTGANKKDDVATNRVRPVKELITAAFKALEAQGKITAGDFKKKYQGGIGISQIPIDKLSAIYDTVCKDFNL